MSAGQEAAFEDMRETEEIAFDHFPEPGTPFYELRVWFGDHFEDIGGYSPGAHHLESDMLRAALWLLLGGAEAHIRMDPAQPGGVRMTFRAVPLGQAGGGSWPVGCEVSRTDLDMQNEPETEPSVIGVTPSLFQLARAVLEHAERRLGQASPSYPLIAMRAALPAIEAEAAARRRASGAPSS